MTSAAELRRLGELQAFDLLDTSPEEALDDIVRRAALVCGTPIALLSLVDRDRQFFKARFGLETTETPREGSFCSQAILAPGLFLVEDARVDARFAGHPFVTGAPGVRFYAAVPLLANGEALGTLCVLDSTARTLESSEAAALFELGREAVVAFQSRRVRRMLARVDSVLCQTRPALDGVSSGLGRILATTPNARHASEAARALETTGGIDRALDAVRLIVAATMGVSPSTPRCPWTLDALVADVVAGLRDAGLRPVHLALSGSEGGAFSERVGEVLSGLIVDLASAGTAPIRIESRTSDGTVSLEITDPEWSFDPDPTTLDDPRATAAVCLRAATRMDGGAVEMRRGGGGAGTRLVLSLPLG